VGEAKVHAAADFSPADLGPLAAALEGRQVEGRVRRWVARVHGVHLDDRAWRIQIFREGDESASVVLRCSHRATADQAAAVLGHWQPTTSFSLLVLNVMSVA
jgi:hypothetical protein